MARALTWGEKIAGWHRRRHPYAMDELVGSEAAETAKAHNVDRVERARERAEMFSDGRYPALEAELRQDLARFEQEGDIVPELFMRIRDQVNRSVDRSRCRREPERVLVRTTDDPAVNAKYRSFADGTGLIHVYEGLSGLIDVLSKQLVLSAGLSAGLLPLLPDDAFTRAAATRAREDQCSFAVDVSLLRWTLLHQRYYGTASSMYRRLPDGAQRVVDSINLRAIEFVVAHECAHHYLGHPGAGAVGVDDVALENEADDAALTLLDLRGAFGTTDALGALVAILALECFDHVSSVRSGHTHPAPRARLERVLARVPEHRSRTVVELSTRVQRVAERARDLDEFVEASWWKTMMDDGDVLLQPRRERDVQQVFETDRVGAGPLANADRVLAHIGHESELDLVGIAARLRTSSWDEGLTALGVQPKSHPAIFDHERALAFSSLMSHSTSGLKRLGLHDPTQQLVAAITFSRIIEHRVLEETTCAGQ